MRKYDLTDLINESKSVTEYLSILEEKSHKFREELAKYQLNGRVVEGIIPYAQDHIVIAFSAEWCSDCQRNIPVLKLISDATGIAVRVFGGLMRDPIDSTQIWHISPSPEEVEIFNVTKIPHITVLDLEGEKIGEIIENPPEGRTLEEALLNIFQCGKTS
jgi:hypothetical protein